MCEHMFKVKPRKQPQSIGCGKTFRGTSALRMFPPVHTWLVELAKELEERIAEDREEHARLPRLLTVVRSSAGWLTSAQHMPLAPELVRVLGKAHS